MRRFTDTTILFTLLLLDTVSLSAQFGNQGELRGGFPAAVTSVSFGEMGGRGSDYLPASVLGRPDTTGRRDVAATDPKQVLSIGLGGEIVLDFGSRLVLDRPGPDLVIFENPFVYTLGGNERIYAEPAEVSVSRDGVEWVSFPFDSVTLAGAAGVTPVNGDADPFDPELSGGDLFDFSLIGVDSIRYLRLIDVTPIVRDDRDHPLWDITLNGFDLDAVIAYSTVEGDGASLSVPEVEPILPLVERSRRKAGYLYVTLAGRTDAAGQIQLDLFTVDGRRIGSATGRSGEIVAIPLNVIGPIILRASNDRASQSGVM